MNNKNFEYKTKKQMEKAGYFFVRQAKSSFPDLIAIGNDGKVMFIECKVGGRLSKEEKEKFIKLREAYKIDVCLAYPEKQGKKVIAKIEAI
jgi:Holliday junction resolvase